jgi:2-C-methyl-D-erythritol 2,4-cyclodiphosphate synthase
MDVHQLAPGLSLWIGGVLVPSDRGAVAHSDGDVLLHALCDALLGALALGDIGMHFPNNDPAYRGIDSKKLLSRCMELVREKGYRVVNVDASICLEAPKIKKHSPEMRSIIATLLGVTTDDVSIKATTTETLGFVGRGEGLSAYANVLLQKQP